MVSRRDTSKSAVSIQNKILVSRGYRDTANFRPCFIRSISSNSVLYISSIKASLIFFFIFFFHQEITQNVVENYCAYAEEMRQQVSFSLFFAGFFLFFELNERVSFISSLHIFCFCPACADRSGDFSPFHSIVYVHPPPTYSLRASASFTDRLLK